MRKINRLYVAALSVASVTAAPVAAQEAGSRQTREFVQAAGQSDQFEILEGQTALTQSTDSRIRAFAGQMIRDHEQTRQALAAAAARAGLQPPPMAMGDDQARLLSELQSLHGEQFDQAYLRHQALAHRSALVVEQAYATGGDDAAVRQAATSATPLIASHLAMAEQMRVSAGGS